MSEAMERATGTVIRISRRLVFAILVPGAVGGAAVAMMLCLTTMSDQVFLVENHTNAGPYLIPAEPTHIARKLFEFVGLGAAIGFLWGLLPMIILGLPAHALLIRRSSASLWMYALCGAAAGSLFVSVLSAQMLFVAHYPEIWGDYFTFIGAGALGGTVAATTFWAIRRPDRDAAKRRLQERQAA